MNVVWRCAYGMKQNEIENENHKKKELEELGFTVAWVLTRGGSARPSNTQHGVDGVDDTVQCRHVLVDHVSSVHFGHACKFNQF